MINQNYEEPQTCCFCIEINKGMKIMGILNIFSSIMTIIQGIIQIKEGMWFGAVNILMNMVVFLLAYWYFLWFRADTKENRKNVTKGFKYVFVFNVISVVIVFFALLLMPFQNLPDKVPDGRGGMEVWDDEKKQKVKHGILVAVPILGFLVCMVYYYYYTVALKWSTLQPLLRTNY